MSDEDVTECPIVMIPLMSFHATESVSSLSFLTEEMSNGMHT